MCELKHGMARKWHGRGMGAAWARHGHGILCVNPPLLYLYIPKRLLFLTEALCAYCAVRTEILTVNRMSHRN
jgi:hypothetical protein